jgi:diguanylate cyclase (GGDEF)-like protein/PAS domain S-box-containing protein
VSPRTDSDARPARSPRILIIEDAADDVELLIYALRRAGIDPDYSAVDTIPALQAELARQRWDIVLADHNVPGTDFATILKVSKSDDPDRPVIVVSGSIGEEIAVELMRNGVADLILKNNLARLGPAIVRELAAAQQQQARREADERFRNIVEVTGEWIWETDENHRFTYFSESFEHAKWLSSADRIGKTRWELQGAEPLDDADWQRHRADLEARRPFRNYRTAYWVSNRLHYLATSGVPFFDHTGTWRGYRGMARDDTAIVEAYHRAEAAEATLRDAVESISEGFVILDAEDRIVLVNEAYRRLYPEVADIIMPGASYTDLMLAMIAKGTFPEAAGSEAEWFAGRMAEHNRLTGNTVYRIKDGRSLLVTERRMRNGGTAGLRMDITALKTAEAERDFHAQHDAITGLPNQTLFTERLSQALRDLEPASLVAVLGVELTSLTDIRAGQGLDAGDAALRETGRRLQAALPMGGVVAHVGNGRYLAFALETEDEAEVMAAVARLVAELEAGFTIDGIDAPLRIVVGGSTAPADGDQAETLIRNATTALRELKANPLQRYQFYRAEMTKAAIHRSTMESDLRRAIERNELLLHYQPQVDVRSYRIVGAEALIRWAHPERGLIPPGQFIPIAEETGLIVQLGEYALRQACAEARTWRNDFGVGVPVAVNLSAVQLAEQDLEQVVLSILSSSGLAPEMLKLELTESAILSDTAAATRTMRSLSDRGIRFALDDFGMEHSSLSLLSHLPIEILKIDQIFVSKMTEERTQAGLVQAIISMTHSLGMTALAEGVERADQLTYLQAYGCDALQGFLFSRPVPPETLRQMLLTGSISPVRQLKQ